MNSNDGSTSCDKAREWIADALLSRADGPATDSAEMERHLAGCASCRAFREESRAMWAALAELPTPATRADARVRFDHAVRDELRAGGSAWNRRRMLAVAAAFLLGVLLGYGAGAGSVIIDRARVASATSDSTHQYLLLLYDTRATGLDRTPSETAALIAEYSAWARGLRAAGTLVTAEKLTDAPPIWYGGAVRTTDGERIGGFFLIRARDASEARRIAESCPHLKHGGRIELRPIQPT